MLGDECQLVASQKASGWRGPNGCQHRVVRIKDLKNNHLRAVTATHLRAMSCGELSRPDGEPTWALIKGEQSSYLSKIHDVASLRVRKCNCPRWQGPAGALQHDCTQPRMLHLAARQIQIASPPVPLAAAVADTCRQSKAAQR